MTGPLERLASERIPFVLCSYSSLDRYFRVREPGPLYLATDSEIWALARAFDDLEYPGLPLEDAVTRQEGTGSSSGAWTASPRRSRCRSR